MGKSIKPLLEGNFEKIHNDDEILSAEIFGHKLV